MSTLASTSGITWPGRIEIGAERHDRDGRERGHHRDDRREDEVELVHVARQRVLLEEHLAAVGHHVENSEPLQKRAEDRHPGEPERMARFGPGRPWIHAETLRSAIEHAPPIGKITAITARPLRRPCTTG